LALSVPLSRFTSQVGGGSAYFVRPHYITHIMNEYSTKFEVTEDGFIIIKQTKPKVGEFVIHHSNVKSFTDMLLKVASDRKAQTYQPPSHS